MNAKECKYLMICEHRSGVLLGSKIYGFHFDKDAFIANIWALVKH